VKHIPGWATTWPSTSSQQGATVATPTKQQKEGVGSAGEGEGASSQNAG